MLDSGTKRLISTRGVRKRYDDASARTIERWVEKGVLPPPDQIISRRKFWWTTTLEANERRLVAERAQRPSQAVSATQPLIPQI